MDRRPQLDLVLADLEEGDTLTVWRLDRLGRSTRHLLELMTELERRESVRVVAGVPEHHHRGRKTDLQGFYGVVFAAIAELERALTVGRARAGLAAARARGSRGPGGPWR